MLGDIAGDIIGSVCAYRPIKITGIPLFSPGCRFMDDTILTVALTNAVHHAQSGLRRQHSGSSLPIPEQGLGRPVTQ
ncbi:MAG: hypothetical protein HPY65_04775 [Syntrophaceae bacterium]|nr:hypothetical protein [Syntrophaceae bacterium]